MSISFNQPFGQTLDTGSRADIVYLINNAVIKAADHHGLLKTRFRLDYQQVFFADYRLAKSATNTKTLLYNSVQTLLWRLIHFYFSVKPDNYASAFISNF